MLVRVDVVAVVELVAADAARWEDAYRDWRQAVEIRDRVANRMDRLVMAATGGLSLARWEAVCRRRCIRSITDAQQKARAIRDRPSVTAAVADRDRAVAVEDARVLTARVVLADASTTLVSRGTAGAGMVGRTGLELRRLARRPHSC
jgi:hypothetical protein